MRALILNSGTGSRMGKLTLDMPKCLLEIAGDVTVLSNQLDIIKQCGIREVILTTGPFEEKIQAYLGKRYNDLQITCVSNPSYKTTNYIYSMYLAREYLNEEILLLHGDLIFKHDTCDMLLKSEYENAVTVEKTDSLPDKDFKARLDSFGVQEIGIDVFGQQCVSLLPFYRLSKSGMAIWLEEIESFIENGNVSVYAENAFNKRAEEIKLQPVYLEEQLCMEIDTPADLEKAKREYEKD